MPHTSDEDHFRRAAERHHDDAVHLQDSARLPNADHHYGFAVECALKSLMLRYGGASMGPKKNGKLPNKPWIGSGQNDLGHLPGLWSELRLHLHGRSGGKLMALLTRSEPFDTWDVSDRYRECPGLLESTVTQRKKASTEIMSLHQEALLAGRLP
ncbi:hypothetical protein [Nocardia sp. NPDC023988]|uniref:hypothetical protein n=1 Tax=unclassified Nocardia TaxID=2637762 RepID=UPI0033E72E26